MLSEKVFNAIFLQRDPFYAYASFIGAIKALPAIVIKVETRGGYMYRITRIDKSTGISTVVRQDHAKSQISSELVEGWLLIKLPIKAAPPHTS